MSAAGAAPSNGTSEAARLFVLRVGRTYGKFRKLRVLLDGEEIGTVAHGQVASFPVAPGPHIVQVKMDWVVSDPVPFLCRPGGRYDVRCVSPVFRLRDLFLKTLWQRASIPYTVEVLEQDG